MSSDDRIVFTKGNIDTYLKALAKEYRKLKNTENSGAGSSVQR